MVEWTVDAEEFRVLEIEERLKAPGVAVLVHGIEGVSLLPAKRALALAIMERICAPSSGTRFTFSQKSHPSTG